MTSKFDDLQKKYFGQTPKDRETILSDSVFDNDRFFKQASSFEVEENYEDPSGYNYGDSINEYKINSAGHRSAEFYAAPLITAGCSMTFGVGVPFDGIWSTMLAKKLNMDHVNLAIPGWSIEAVVDNLFKYFYKYGNPKKLAVLFPDYNRVIMTSHREFAVIDPHVIEEPQVKIINVNLHDEPAKEKVKYSKKPHKILNILTPEYSLFRSLSAISRLITYCKSSNIEFVWSTWDEETDKVFKLCRDVWNQEFYKDYISIDLGNDLHSKTCHPEYLKIYGENFYTGYDKSSLDSMPHPGVHQHVHYAESIYKKLKETL